MKKLLTKGMYIIMLVSMLLSSGAFQPPQFVMAADGNYSAAPSLIMAEGEDVTPTPDPNQSLVEATPTPPADPPADTTGEGATTGSTSGEIQQSEQQLVPENVTVTAAVTWTGGAEPRPETWLELVLDGTVVPDSRKLVDASVLTWSVPAGNYSVKLVDASGADLVLAEYSTEITGQDNSFTIAHSFKEAAPAQLAPAASSAAPAADPITVKFAVNWYEDGDPLKELQTDNFVGGVPSYYVALHRSLAPGGSTELVAGSIAKLVTLPEREVSWEGVQHDAPDGTPYTFVPVIVDGSGNPVTHEFVRFDVTETAVNIIFMKEAEETGGSPEGTSEIPGGYFTPPSLLKSRGLFAAQAMAINPGEVSVSKIATPVAGMVNTWDITLEILAVDQPQSSCTVLVIDRSGSMLNSGRMQAAKDAATNFVNLVVPDTNSLNRVAVVSFAETSTTNAPLTNNKDTLTNAIASFEADGGTYTQAGIKTAQGLLANATGCTTKNIVLLSDGEPTYSTSHTVEDSYFSLNAALDRYVTNSTVPESAYNGGYKIGNGRAGFRTVDTNDWICIRYSGTRCVDWRYAYWHHGQSTINQAGYAKTAGTKIYTVAVSAGDFGTSVLDAVASPGLNYSTDDSNLIDTLFGQIAASILAACKNASITDPMATGFQVVGDVSSLTTEPIAGKATFDSNTGTITWNPGTLTEPVSSGSSTKYARLKYRVEINDNILTSPLPEQGTLYATNGTTTLNYTDINNQSAAKDFVVPQVNPVFYTLTKVVKDADGNVKTGDTHEFTITLDNDNALDTNDPKVKVIKAGETKTYTDLRYQGTYTVTETGVSPATAELTDYTITVVPQTFTIVNTETVDQSVTVTNQELPLGALQVCKVFSNTAIQPSQRVMMSASVSVPSFAFSVSGPSYTTPLTFTLPGGECKDLTGLKYGEYTVTETDSQGFVQSSVPADGKVTLTVDAPTATVTVTNRPAQDGDKTNIQANKIWNDTLTSHPVIAFQLYRQGAGAEESVGSPVVLDGTVDTDCTVPSGTCEYAAWKANWADMLIYEDGSGAKYTYSVKEGVVLEGVFHITPPAGYAKSETGLTVTNTPIEPKLTLVKIVAGADDVAANAWMLSATGDGGFSGKGTLDTTTVANDAVLGPTPVKAKIVYTLGEDGPSGFTPSPWSCVGGTFVEGTIMLNYGESATCTVTNTAVKPKLTLIKKLIPENEEGLLNWTLKADGPVDISGTSGSSGVTNALVEKGTYVLSEAGPTGYTASDWSCVGGTYSKSGNPEVETIQLDHGQDATCTITNTKKASIELKKAWDGAAASTTLYISTNTEELGDIAQVTANDQTSTTGAILVEPGTYFLDEDDIPGYTSALTCSLNDGDAIVNAGSIALAAGDSAVCTFTNTQKGRIIVDKKTVPAGDATSFAFTTTGAGYNDFNLTDTAAPNDQQLPVGSYSVAETAVTGWDTTYICESSIPNKGVAPSSIILAAGETVTCTFTNTKRASIELVKSWVGAVGSVTLSIGTTSGGNDVAKQVTTTSTLTTGANLVIPGTYYLSETTPDGYTSALVCSLNNGTATANAGSIALAAGDVAVCTYTNTQKGSITVDKVTVPDTDSTSFAFTTTGTGYTSFSLTGAGTPNTQALQPGKYSVAETVPAGWTQNSATCTSTLGATQTPGNIDLVAGESVTCTFTNTKKASIELKKAWVGTPGNVTLNIGTSAGGSQVDTQLTSDTVLTTGANLVDPGTFYVSESALPDYTTTLACTIDGQEATVGTNNALTLAAGQVGVCTFTNTQKGRIIVDKKTVPSGSDQSFTFTTTGEGYNGFSLTDGAAANNQQLPVGTYSVAETPVTGWDLTDSTCSSSVAGKTQEPAAINLAAGETVTCTFTNTQKGHIVVDKVTVPSGSAQSFDFTGNGPGISPFSLTDAATPKDFMVVPGDYSISETLPTGWTQTSATCSSSVTDKKQEPAAIDLEAGETVTCTFTNTQKGTISIDKVTAPAGSAQLFMFTTTGTGLNGFMLKDTDPAKSFSVDPGTFSVAETVPDGWTQTSAICTSSIQGKPQKPSEIKLEANESVSCTFINTQKGHIIVDKVTVPSGSTQSFNFTGSGVGISSSFSLTDAADPKDFMVEPGDFTIAETALDGWTQTSATCSSSVAGKTQEPAAIDLEAGETVTCTFTNTQKGHIIVDKVTIPSGSAQSFDFTGTGPGISPFSLTDTVTPKDFMVEPGNFTIAETALDGWTQTSATCTTTVAEKTQTPDAIDLEAGETVTCTFTNTQKGHIVVDKVTVPSGSAQSFDFTGNGPGISPFSLTDAATPKDFMVVPGDYSISETLPTGWTQTSATCSSSVTDKKQEPAAIDLEAGETVTCTFTNTQKGTISIDKVTAPAGSAQLFMFTTTGTGLNGFMLKDTDPAKSFSVDPGTFSVAETVPDGWTQTSAICTSSIQGKPQKPSEIKLEANESVSCTFINTQKGHIIVDKVTVPSGSAQSFDFTGTGPGISPFSLTDTATPKDFMVEPGNFTIAETALDGWTQTSATCSSSVTGKEQAPDTIGLEAGETVTCTFTNTQKGHIIVDKVTVPSGSAQSFDFTGTGPGISPFSLTDAATPKDFMVEPGDFTIAETALDGWTQTSATCTTTVAEKTQTPDAIDLEAGETVTCTFTNTQKGHIIIDKVTVPSGSTQSFNFTGSGPGISPFSLTDAATPKDFMVEPGNFTIAETALDGWTQTSATCSSSVTGKEQAPDTIGLEAGETVTCTFTNSKIPQLTLVKVVDVGDALASNWRLTATAGNDPNNISDLGKPIAGDDNDAQVGPEPVTPGVAYTLGESASITGYSASAWTCTSGTLTTTEIKTQTITLAYGDDVTCTITNTGIEPKLTLVKAFAEGTTGDTDDWTLTATKGIDIISGVTGDEEITDAEVAVGKYILTESALDGYTSTGWACVGGEYALNEESGEESVTLTYGDEATCTVTNAGIAPTLQLVKEFSPAGSGTLSNFTLTATGTDPANTFSYTADNTAVVTVIPGVYTLEETGSQKGFTNGETWTCDSDKTVTDKKVTLAYGDEVTCTITNTAIQPKLTLQKVVTGGPATTAHFDLTATGTSTGASTISGPMGETVTNVTVMAGTYTLSEAVNETGTTAGITPAMYSAGAWTCDGGSLTGTTLTLTYGDTAVCSITNTYNIPKIPFTGIKTWVGGTARPPVTLVLYRQAAGMADPELHATGVVDGTVDANETVAWQYTWTGLDETTIDMRRYTYFIREQATPGGYNVDYPAANTARNTVIPPPPPPPPVVPIIPVTGGFMIPVTGKPFIPYTGDESNAWQYAAISLSSLMAFAILLVLGRRQAKKER